MRRAVSGRPVHVLPVGDVRARGRDRGRSARRSPSPGVSARAAGRPPRPRRTARGSTPWRAGPVQRRLAEQKARERAVVAEGRGPAGGSGPGERGPAQRPKRSRRPLREGPRRPALFLRPVRIGCPVFVVRLIRLVCPVRPVRPVRVARLACPVRLVCAVLAIPGPGSDHPRRALLRLHRPAAQRGGPRAAAARTRRARLAGGRRHLARAA